MSTKIPRGLLVPAETKRTGRKYESTNAAQRTEGVLKPQKENMQRKNVVTKVHKGVSTRYGQEAELKEQNQHLMSVNEELQKKLTETQERVAMLELQFSDIEKENADVQKNLRDCHVLLVAARIDPVSGGRVGEAAQQNEDQRKEAMSVSSDLLSELRTFGDVASQQLSRLEVLQASMTDLAKARERMMQEREDFALEAAEMQRALTEAESLLCDY